MGRAGSAKFNIYSPAPCPSPEHFRDIAPLIDICIPNQTEAVSLTGELEVEEAARAIQRMGVKNVLVTLGGDGFALLQENGAFKMFPLARKVSVVDTTGAGDSFSGALAFSLNQNPPKSLEESAQFASLVASHSVQKKGTQKSYPTLKEIQL